MTLASAQEAAEWDPWMLEEQRVAVATMDGNNDYASEGKGIRQCLRKPH